MNYILNLERLRINNLILIQMLDYQIICPTYNRPLIFKNKTYSFLQRTNAPLDKLTVFVASEEQKELYQQLDLSLNIVIGVKGIAKQRNFIQNYYPLNTKIISIDDDISNIYIKQESSKKPLKDFDTLVTQGFDFAQNSGSRVFGVYPISNGFFQRNIIRQNLCLIVGAFYGFWNDRILIPQELETAEDIYLSFYYYKLQKKLCRLDFVGLQTQYYNPNGGLSEDRTLSQNYKDKYYIACINNLLCNLVERNNRTEIRFKRTKEPSLDVSPDKIKSLIE